MYTIILLVYLCSTGHLHSSRIQIHKMRRRHRRRTHHPADRESTSRPIRRERLANQPTVSPSDTFAAPVDTPVITKKLRLGNDYSWNAYGKLVEFGWCFYCWWLAEFHASAMNVPCDTIRSKSCLISKNILPIIDCSISNFPNYSDHHINPPARFSDSSTAEKKTLSSVATANSPRIRANPKLHREAFQINV